MDEQGDGYDWNNATYFAYDLLLHILLSAFSIGMEGAVMTECIEIETLNVHIHILYETKDYIWLVHLSAFLISWRRSFSHFFAPPEFDLSHIANHEQVNSKTRPRADRASFQHVQWTMRLRILLCRLHPRQGIGFSYP